MFVSSVSRNSYSGEVSHFNVRWHTSGVPDHTPSARHVLRRLPVTTWWPARHCRETVSSYREPVCCTTSLPSPDMAPHLTPVGGIDLRYDDNP